MSSPQTPGSGSHSFPSHGAPSAPGHLSSSPSSPSIRGANEVSFTSTPGATPDGPRDLLADANYFRELARIYSGLGIWSIAMPLESLAEKTEALHEHITARRSRRSGTSPFFLEGQA